jgi:hypothetical protein
MRKAALIAVILLSLLLLHGRSSTKASSKQNSEFLNGHWFDGSGFVRKDFYTVDGLFATEKPAHIDHSFDLTAKFVVPPFGEAHNHNVEGANVEAVIRKYLEAGIFYVKNPTSLPRTMAPVLDKINRPTSIDVVFARGGLTASGGHPLGLVQRNIDRKIWTEADGEGAFYFTINTRSDLDRQWARVRAGKPDFIKTFLLYSEEYAKRKDDPAYFGWKGLDPGLLPEIVQRAHKDGLRVSTHIESAADFHHASIAGVDEINHLPGFRADGKLPPSIYEISEEDAELAAEKGVVVVTTLGAIIAALRQIDPQSTDEPTAQKYLDLLVRNLALLKKYGVRIAIGSDSYRQTSLEEALRLHELNVFDNQELLKMWCETTPATIFPRRMIGHLQKGYEASFLVLSDDPIKDFLNVQKIEIRVKQGEILSLGTE